MNGQDLYKSSGVASFFLSFLPFIIFFGACVGGEEGTLSRGPIIMITSTTEFTSSSFFTGTLLIKLDPVGRHRICS